MAQEQLVLLLELCDVSERTMPRRRLPPRSPELLQYQLLIPVLPSSEPVTLVEQVRPQVLGRE